MRSGCFPCPFVTHAAQQFRCIRSDWCGNVIEILKTNSDLPWRPLRIGSPALLKFRIGIIKNKRSLFLKFSNIFSSIQRNVGKINSKSANSVSTAVTRRRTQICFPVSYRIAGSHRYVGSKIFPKLLRRVAWRRRKNGLDVKRRIYLLCWEQYLDQRCLCSIWSRYKWRTLSCARLRFKISLSTQTPWIWFLEIT